MPTNASKRNDTSVVEELRERWPFTRDYWDEEIHPEGAKDMRCIAGDVWDAKERETREKAMRPCLSPDELTQYTNTAINDVRANPRGVKFSPVGRGANDQGAQFYADKMREIEYRSHAQIAYTTAFQNEIERSYGFVQLTTRYRSIYSSKQELWIEEIANPDSIFPDPAGMRPDSSDVEFLFKITSQTHAEYKRTYGKDAQPSDLADMGADGPAVGDWLTDKRIQLAEYWAKEYADDVLLTLQPQPTQERSLLGLRPSGMPEDVLQSLYQGGRVVTSERAVKVPHVRQYLTNGREILSQTDWLGTSIPFASAYGKILYVNDGGLTKRKILSFIRLARVPAMAYAFYRTCEMENVGLTTKNPYWAYRGQLNQDEVNAIAQSMHEPVALLTAAATLPDVVPGTVLPLPQRNVNEAYIQALSLGAEEMRRAIQAAMGISPLPTTAQRQNQKSGIALDRIDQAEQRGSFHFVDHYNDMIREIGVKSEELIEKVYGGPQETGVIDAQGKASTVRINDPQQGQGGQKPIMVAGDYQVTVSTGPSADSTRDIESKFVTDFIANKEVLTIVGPQKAQRILARGVKLMNVGPAGDEVAEIIDPSLGNEGDEPNPEALKQQLQQAQQQMQQAHGVIEKMQKALETDSMKLAAQKEIEQMKLTANATLQIQLKTMDNAAKIEAARISAAKQTADLTAEQLEERIALMHEGEQNELDRQHEAAMQTQDHVHTLAEGDAAHQQGLEAGQAGHDNAIEQMTTQAALEPAPAEGASA